jgi:hypothetical protein
VSASSRETPVGARRFGLLGVRVQQRQEEQAVAGERAVHQCTRYDLRMPLDERDFFNSRNETRTDKLNCPRCKRVNDYQMRWVVRTRKDRIPPGADERDRAMYAKLRDYMIRVDDSVTCKTCGKKFDIPSQHSMVFLERGGAPASTAGAAQGDDDTRFNR